MHTFGYTSAFIRKYIFALPLGRLFTTRHLLAYGTRAAVDQCMTRLVKGGLIIRLARGVFVRQGSQLSEIRVQDVAAAKAASFGRKIAAWGGQLVSDLGFFPNKGNETIFCINTSSSSFKFGETTIYLKKTCARKMRLGDTQAGKILKALWYLGRRQVSTSLISQAFSLCRRTDKEEIRQALCWLPSWLGCNFLDGKWRPNIFDLELSMTVL